MKILYRNPENNTLAITDVTNSRYDTDEKMLTFFGSDDLSFQVDKKTADKLTRTLFTDDKLDLTEYKCEYYDWPDDDDEFDDDDNDDDGRFFIDPSVFLDL